MKYLLPYRFVLTGFCLWSILANNAVAALYYWDNNGASASTSGTWNTTSAQWATSSTLTASPVVWNTANAAAFPCGAANISALTITVNSPIAFAGVFNGLVTAGPGVTNLTISGSGSLSLNANLQGFWTGNGSWNTLIRVPITGAGGVQNQSGGSLFLSGNNSYGGGTSLGTSAGLNFNNGSALGTGTITNAVTPTVLATPATDSTGAAFTPTSAMTVANAWQSFGGTSTAILVGLSGAPITFSGPWTLTGAAGTTTTLDFRNTTFTISGVISGAANLTKASATSTLILSGANTYSGNTTVSAGTLAQGAANVIPSGSGKGTFAVSSGATFDLGGFDCTVNNAATAGAIDNTGGGAPTFTIGGNNTGVTISGVIKNTAGTLGVTKTGSGAMVLSGVNTYSGKTIVNGGTLTINTSGDSCLGAAPGSPVADQLTLNNGVTFGLGTAVNTTLSANRGIQLSGSVTITMSSKTLTVPGIISGTGSLIKSGSTDLILSGANTYSGGTTVTGGGLTLNNNFAIGTGGLTVTPAGICTITGKSGTTVLTNNITVNVGGGQVIDFFATSGGNNLTLNGQISGSAAIFRGNGGGAGNVTLNGNNSTYSGTLTLQQGPLVLGHKNALGTGTFVVTPGAVAISLSANTTLTGANAVANATTLNGTLPVTGASDLELSGVISGASGAISKSGSGKLILGGANTYGGATTVTAGTLLVNNGSGSGTGPGAVTILTGATLGGIGTIGGLVTVNSGGTLSPGSSIGTLTLNATPSLSGTTAMELDNSGSPNADRLVISGNPLVFGGALTVTNIGPTLVGGETFDLFDATGFSGAFTVTNLPTLGAGLNWWTSNLGTDGTITVNRAPTASDKAYSRQKGVTLKIFKSELMASVSDPDSGDSASYDALVGLGSQGANVTEDANLIYYEPTNDISDTLQFRVKDTRGGTTTKNISITVLDGTGQATSVVVSGSTATVNFAGIPGRAYQVQRSTNLVDWVTLVTTNAPGNGIFQWVDDFSDLGVPPADPPSAAYYDLKLP